MKRLNWLVASGLVLVGLAWVINKLYDQDDYYRRSYGS